MTSINPALANPLLPSYATFNARRTAQTPDNSRSRPAAQDTVSISAAGRQALKADTGTQANAGFQQLLAEKTTGQNFLRNAALANPHSSSFEQFAYDLAHDPLSDGQGGAV